jgi:predicted GIY-YIG superfamily endonuclease
LREFETGKGKSAMTVYLLHLDEPLKRGIAPNGKPLQAAHYIGFTDDLAGRLLEHLDGKGARFTQVCVERGIQLSLARGWEGGLADRKFERRLKRCKNSARICPICNPNALNRMSLENIQ